MSLRRFLNVAYSILVEEYQRMGVGLIAALEKVAELGEGSETTSSTASAAQNMQSMEMLQKRLAGVQGTPKMRPHRA